MTMSSPKAIQLIFLLHSIVLKMTSGYASAGNALRAKQLSRVPSQERTHILICPAIRGDIEEAGEAVGEYLKRRFAIRSSGIFQDVKDSGKGATALRLKKEYFETFLRVGDQTHSAQLVAEGETSNRYEDYFSEKSRIDTISNCPVFQGISTDEIKKVANCMDKVDIKEGECIVKEGAEADAMYIVVDGEFVCYRESSSQILSQCRNGDYFGDLGVIFREPRQATVRASTDSVVWKLEGKDFLDVYSRAKISKFSWLFFLLGSSQETNLPVIKPILRACRKGLASVIGFFDKVKLLDNHLVKGGKKTVSRAVVVNMLLCSSTIPILMKIGRAHHCSSASYAIVNFGSACLVYDNFVNAYGKYYGNETFLKKMTKIRCLLHGMLMPLFFVPLMDVLKRSKLVSRPVANICSLFVSAFALKEAIDWAKFDIKDMKLVDNRDSTKNSGLAFAGGFCYTSGKVLKLVLPAVIMNLSSIGIGFALLLNGSPAGKWLLSSSLFTFFTNVIQKPLVQMFGETVLLWAIAMSLFSF